MKGSVNKAINNKDNAMHYECVEPNLGAQMWRLEDKTTAVALRSRLKVHLSICHRCRLLTTLDQRLGEGVRTGAIQSSEGRLEWLHRLPGLLAAACLALVFLLPPESDRGPVLERAGAEYWKVIQPISGELLTSHTPLVKWEPLERATSYKVEISGLDVEFNWSSTISATELRLPPETGLPDQGKFQVVVTPVPGYLASPTGAVSWFRTGGWMSLVVYRLFAAPMWLQIVLVGLFVGSLVMGFRRFRRVGSLKRFF